MVHLDEGPFAHNTEFFIQMQSRPNGVVVLAATHAPWQLTQAYLRRFEKRIYVPLPDTAVRGLLFREFVHNFPHSLSNQDFDILAQQTVNYSAGDIFALVQTTQRCIVRLVCDATHFRKVPGNLSPIHQPVAEQAPPERCFVEKTGNWTVEHAKVAISEIDLTPRAEQVHLHCRAGQEENKISLELENKISEREFETSQVQESDNFLWAPCQLQDEGAQAMSLTDVPRDRLYVPPLTLEHFQIRPQALPADHTRMQKWAQDHDYILNKFEPFAS
jgi:SpoVK/Ycf46/Vps4 family AAA+-type ATPase